MDTMHQPPESLQRPAPAVPNSWLRTDVLILLGIFIVFYYFRLSTFSIAIDDEFGAVRDSPDVWLIQGRWGVYLLERLVLHEQVVPFFPFFVFGCCLSISYPVLLSAFGVARLRFIHFAAFPLYVAFPIWIFSLSFFSNTIGFGLGQLCSACAIYFARPLLAAGLSSSFARPAWRSTAAALALSATFAALAISMYQSFCFSIATLGLALIATYALHLRGDWRAVFGSCTMLAVALVAGIVLYEAIELVLLSVLHLGNERYVGNFLNLPALLRDPLHVAAVVLLDAGRTYTGSDQVYGTSAHAFGLVLACGVVALVSWPGVTLSRRALLLLGAAAMLGLPFALHLASGGALPARTLVAVPTMMWFFALLGMSTPRLWLARLSLLAVMLATLQSLYVVNLLQTANEFARKHDEALAAAVYARILDANPGNGTRPLLVDFYGAQQFDSAYPRPTPATQGYSFFEWDGGNGYRIVAYMRLLGYTPLQMATREQRRRDDTVFAQMSAWPDAGAVRVVDGVTLIKLGTVPGFR